MTMQLNVQNIGRDLSYLIDVIMAIIYTNVNNIRYTRKVFHLKFLTYSP